VARRGTSRLGLRGACVSALLAVLCSCAGARVNAGRLEIAGRPLFLIEAYSLADVKDAEAARRFGFNATINEFPRIIRAARDHGLLVTIPDWFEGELDLARLDARIERYRALRGVWAWNVGDEPDLRPRRSPPELLGRAARYIRSAMPGVLLSATLSGAKGATDKWPLYVRELDVIRVTPYPLLEGADAALVYKRVRRAREIAGGRAVIAVLDQWTMPGKPYPKAEQFRLYLYAALAAGATGISVYQYEADRWLNKPGFADSMRPILAEARRVGSILVRAKQRVLGEEGDLKRVDFSICALRRFTLAVNLGDKSATLTLPVNPLALERARRYLPREGRTEALETKAGAAVVELGPGQAALCERAPLWLPPLSMKP